MRCGLKFFLGVLAVVEMARAETSVKVASDGRRVHYTENQSGLLVEFPRADLVHFEFSGRSEQQNVNLPIYTTPMIKKLPSGIAPVRSQDSFELTTTDLKVEVEKGTLCISVFDRIRKVSLVRNCPRNLQNAWKGLSLEMTGIRNLYGLGNYFMEPGQIDGDWVGRQWDMGAEAQGNALKSFASGATSYAQFPILYALGEGQQGFAIFVDQLYKMAWTFRGNPWQVEMWGDQIRWFVLSGPSLRNLRRDYMTLTGLPPLPPKKAFGLWVSEFGFENWTEAYRPVVELRQSGFPLDGLGMDLQWFGGTFFGDPETSRMGTLQFDATSFPGAAAEINHLRTERGVNLMVIEESYVSKYLPEHEQLRVKGGLAHQCGDPEMAVYLSSNPWWGVGGMIDWTNLAAGDFWHDLKRQKLYELGITDHWTDLGEPEMYDAGACYYGFPEIGKRRHGDVHNIYNFKWLESIARGYERNKNTFRPYTMSRSGTSGVQRFGAGLWSGDIAANMSSLLSHYRVHSQMSLAGVDYFSSDIGGFHRRSNTLDGDANDLFTQWFANASLFDFPVRSHTWNLENNLKTSPHEMGHVASNRANIYQRYRLSPYYYSLAFRASQTGEPVLPPMVYAFQSDPNVRIMNSQKMIGPFLMAAVLGSYGSLEKDVYLPKGKWFNFHTLDATKSAGKNLERLPIFQDGVMRAPMFARAGAIIPQMVVDHKTMNILGRREGEGVNRDLILRLFPDEVSSEFELYEDDGETTDYRTGQSARTKIQLRKKESKIQITVFPSQGQWSALDAPRNLLYEVVLEDETVVNIQLNGSGLQRCTQAKELHQQSCWWPVSSKLTQISARAQKQRREKKLTVQVQKAAGTTTAYFVCENGQTEPGTSVYITGDLSLLGSFDPKKAIKLSPDRYSTWTTLVSGLPRGQTIQWKCLMRQESGLMSVVRWQAGEKNQFKTPAAAYSGLYSGKFE